MFVNIKYNYFCSHNIHVLNIFFNSHKNSLINSTKII